MTADQFNEMLERKLADCRTVLAGKAEEYSHGGDRLSNFKQAAQMLGCQPEGALLGFVTKHITALYDFVAALENGKQYTIEQWAEKTGDIRNYMVLLDGLIEERLRRHPSVTYPMSDDLPQPTVKCGNCGYLNYELTRCCRCNGML